MPHKSSNLALIPQYNYYIARMSLFSFSGYQQKGPAQGFSLSLLLQFLYFFCMCLNVETFNLKPSFQIRRCSLFLMFVTVVHHTPSCRPLSHGVIWPAADLQSFPQFGRFSARSSRINPRVSGRWAEAGVCDLLTLTSPRLRGQQVRAANDCNTGEGGAWNTRNSRKINTRTHPDWR